MTRAVVTGATGFVGRALAARLSQKGMRVVACARSETDGPWEEFVRLDIGAASAKWPIKRGDVLVHCAGVAHDVSGHATDADTYEAVNSTGAQLAAVAAREAGAAAFVLISTVKAMAESTPPEGIDESFPCCPKTAYGRSKLRGEQLVAEELEGSDTLLAILRLAPVYGPGTKGNLDRLMRVAGRRWVPLLPPNRGRRTMIHVDDVADVTVLAIDRQLVGTFVVAEERIYSPRQIQAHVAGKDVTGGPSLPVALLKVVGRLGSVLERVLRRPVPFTSRETRRLLEDSIYSGRALHDALKWTPQRSLFDETF